MYKTIVLLLLSCSLIHVCFNCRIILLKWSQGNVASIVSWLHNRGSEVRIPAEAFNLSFCKTSQKSVEFN